VAFDGHVDKTGGAVGRTHVHVMLEEQGSGPCVPVHVTVCPDLHVSIASNGGWGQDIPEHLVLSGQSVSVAMSVAVIVLTAGPVGPAVMIVALSPLG
jgi:hypothetical protein